MKAGSEGREEEMKEEKKYLEASRSYFIGENCIERSFTSFFHSIPGRKNGFQNKTV